MPEVKTLSFSEESKGWTSFWDYEPLFCFSLNSRFYSINESNLYNHYNPSVSQNNFYGTNYPSEVTLILTDNPSVPKVFSSIGYEGSNGWKAIDIQTNEYKPSSNEYGNISTSYDADDIPSYSEGAYIDSGVEYRSGFYRKDNQYFASIKGDGLESTEGEILDTNQTAGIRGVYCQLTMKTDEVTDVGGLKQLFAVSTIHKRS